MTASFKFVVSLQSQSRRKNSWQSGFDFFILFNQALESAYLNKDAIETVATLFLNSSLSSDKVLRSWGVVFCNQLVGIKSSVFNETLCLISSNTSLALISSLWRETGFFDLEKIDYVASLLIQEKNPLKFVIKSSQIKSRTLLLMSRTYHTHRFFEFCLLKKQSLCGRKNKLATWVIIADEWKFQLKGPKELLLKYLTSFNLFLFACVIIPSTNSLHIWFW